MCGYCESRPQTLPKCYYKDSISKKYITHNEHYSQKKGGQWRHH